MIFPDDFRPNQVLEIHNLHLYKIPEIKKSLIFKITVQHLPGGPFAEYA